MRVPRSELEDEPWGNTVRNKKAARDVAEGDGAVRRQWSEPDGEP